MGQDYMTQAPGLSASKSIVADLLRFSPSHAHPPTPQVQ